MATEFSFIEYILEQLREVPNMTYKKMFGEYMLYINGKPVVIVCDNTAMMKPHAFLADKDLETQIPYSGAKEHYVLDPDDREFFTWAILEAEKITPLPKPKKKKV